MKIRALLIPIAAFALVSCGDDKSKTSDTAADTASAATDAAPTTVGEPTLTTVDPIAARVATAQAISGTYTGQWHNTTFNSNGSISATVTVDATTASATISMDLGGNVFGGSDPAPLTAVIDLNGSGPFAGSDPLFGDFTIEYSDGHLTFTAPAVPGLGGKTMTVDGDFAGDSFSGTYAIVDLAEGAFEASRA